MRSLILRHHAGHGGAPADIHELIPLADPAVWLSLEPQLEVDNSADDVNVEFTTKRHTER